MHRLFKKTSCHLIYISQFCMSVCVSVLTPETAIGTGIKLGTIDHHPLVSVIRALVMS